MGMGEYLHADTTKEVIGAAIEVHSVLGSQLLEAVYRRAMMRELEIRGLQFQQEVPIRIDYKGRRVGRYRADLVVEDKVVVELKSVSAIAGGHWAQLQNYLAARGLRVGLLLNFGTPSLQIKRFVL